MCWTFHSLCIQSGSEKTSARSRLGSSNSITSEQSPVADSSENGGEAIDYKALYEAARYVFLITTTNTTVEMHIIHSTALISIRSDNEKLKMQLKKKDDDLMNARAAIERFTNAVSSIYQLNILK